MCATPPTMTATTAMTATAASSAGVGFECKKRNDEKQHDGNAGASRKHQFHRTAELCRHTTLPSLVLTMPPMKTLPFAERFQVVRLLVFGQSGQQAIRFRTSIFGREVPSL